MNVVSSPQGSLDRPPARRWPIFAAVAGAMLLATYLTRTPSLTDWDSWEYSSQAVRQSCSGLCLGRWWFAFLMHKAYAIGTPLGTDTLHSFQPMRCAVALLTCGGVMALMHWTWQLTGRRLPMALAGAMAVASGSLMAYASAVMTEGPTLLLMILCYVFWENALRRAGVTRTAPGAWGKPLQATASPANSNSISLPACRSASLGSAASGAWALASGLAFGIAVNIREPVLVLCVWPVVSCLIDRPRGRWRLLSLAALGTLVTLGLAVTLACIHRGQDPYTWLQGYGRYMSIERSVYGWGKLANVVYLLMHLETASPLLISAAVGFVLWLVLAGGRRSEQVAHLPGRTLAAMALSTLPYALISWYNPDLSFNYRLALPMAWVLIVPGALLAEAVIVNLFLSPSPPWSARKKAVVGGLTVLAVANALVIGAVVLTFHLRYADWQAELFEQLQKLPPGSSVLPGPGVPVVKYLREIGIRPDLVDVMPPPDATPQKVIAQIDAEFSRGRRVFVNLSARNQLRPNGRSPEWEATVGAVGSFDRRPGPGPFVELQQKQQQPATKPTEIHRE